MKIYEYPAEGGLPIGDCAVALGFFDGVHLAHREIIKATVSLAKSRGISSAVFTFPAEQSGIKSCAKRIYSTKERLELIESLGADAVVLADFGAISSLSAERFIKDVLVCDLGCRIALCGYNFRFGRKASGDADTLREFMRLSGGEAIVFEKYEFGGSELSATKIREALAMGEVALAAEMLGSPYRLRGRVSHGLGNGHGLGFPTVNVEIPEIRAYPRLGVYRTLLPIDGKIYTGVTNVGVCPTFEHRAVHAETHIVDFSGDLYGRDVCIYFAEFLRDEARFPDSGALVKQIGEDTRLAVQRNKEDLECGKWTEIGLK